MLAVRTAVVGRRIQVRGIGVALLVAASQLGLPGRAASEPSGCAGRVVDSPERGPASNHLTAVDLVTSSDVWAVGTWRSDQGTDRTLVVRWDGVEWKKGTSPNETLYHDNRLLGVSAATDRRVWAVGYYNDDSIVAHPLILFWNGNRWRLQSAPSGAGQLHSVAALSPNDVWAVGYQPGSGGSDRTLTLHWDGTEWTEVPSPNLGTVSDRLHGVSADGSGLWAVGSSFGTGPTPLVMRWSGSEWTIHPVEGLQGSASLAAVTSPSTGNAWAVGTQQVDGVGRTLVTRYTAGGGWHVVPSQNAGTRTNLLTAVDASPAGGNDVWAAGYFFNAEGFTRTLVERWNGVGWQRLQSPNPGDRGNVLLGVAADPATGAWAVGYLLRPTAVARTLVERFC